MPVFLAMLFMRFDPEGIEGTGVSMKGGITLWQLTYADDSALLCRTATEASQRVSAVRMGFRCDGDKEVSQPKTEAMRMKKGIGKTRVEQMQQDQE